MSHACGADQSLRLHHGTLNAVILPTILDFIGITLAISTRLNAAIGLDASADPAEFIRELNAEIGLPASLREMGCRKTQSQICRAMQPRMFTFTNPRPCSAEEYEGLYEIAIG